MNLVQRVQDILLKPKATWPLIEAEPGDAAAIYKNYLVILALIPAVASFIGLSLVGMGGFGVHFRVPIFLGLVSMVVGYIVSLVMVFVLSLIVDALAPTFGGTRNPLAAFKLVAYAATAGFVGGVFNLLPMLSILGLLAALYGLYLFYIGLPVLMKCPPEKALAYTAVTAVCSIVGWIVIGALLALLTPSPMRMGAVDGGGGAVSIRTPGGEISIDTAKLDAMSKQMEAAGKRMEQAQASGDTAAAGKAAAEVLGALGGNAGGMIPAQDFKALLPETVAGLQRDSIEAQSSSAMGLGGSQARAVYRQGNERLELSISDMGGVGSLMSVAAWASVTLDRETDGKVEKVYKQGQRSVREEYAKDRTHGEYTLILGNGVLVEGRGDNLDMDKVRAAVSGLNLGQLEAMKRPAKS